MFAWVRKLFRQTVNWFRPENGGHTLTIPVHPCPPRSTPVNLGPSLSIPRITHAEKPAEPEAAPAPAPEEPSRHVAEPKEPPPAFREEILIEVAKRLDEAEPKLGLPSAPELTVQERITRAEDTVTRQHIRRQKGHEPDKWLHPIRKPRAPDAPHKPRKTRSVLELEKTTPDPAMTFKADRTHDWDIRPESEDTGVFYFRGALLDRLDNYFLSVARMKRAHRDAYDLYTQLGGTLVPNSTLGAVYELPAFWHDPEHRPAFGCVHVSSTHYEDDDDDRNMLQLMYFEKVKEPDAEVERAPGADIYEVSAYLDVLDPERNKARSKRWQKQLERCGFIFQFFVAVEADGSMRPLKTLQTEWKQIDYRAGTGRYGKTRKQKFSESIPQKHWAYPYNLRWWWKECHEDETEKKRPYDTIEEWSCSLLRIIANFAQSAEFAIRISVENELQHRAVFALDWKRTSYFFKDRDTVLTPKGKPARIFHIVKPHIRKKADGTESAVHLHFRGLRRFKWGKYAVHITVPGLHHIPLTDFTVGLVDVSTVPIEERKGLMNAEYIGRQLAAHLDERKALGELFK